jgi:hypothetical protein
MSHLKQEVAMSSHMSAERGTPPEEEVTREAQIRAIAYELWQEAEQPDGQADRHWAEAKEIWALRQAEHLPIAEPATDQGEPALALENQAPMPGLNDQSDGNIAPSLNQGQTEAR